MSACCLWLESGSSDPRFVCRGVIPTIADHKTYSTFFTEEFRSLAFRSGASRAKCVIVLSFLHLPDSLSTGEGWN